MLVLTARGSKATIASLIATLVIGAGGIPAYAQQISAESLQKFKDANCRMTRGVMSSLAGRGTPAYEKIELAYAKAAEPNGGHEILKKLEGKWETKATIWDVTGKSKEAEAVSTIKAVLDGRFITEEFDEKTSSYRGFGIIGHDNPQNKYFMLWVDTMSSGNFISSGAKTAPDTIVLTGQTKDLIKGSNVTYKQTFQIQSDDKFTYVMHINNRGNKKSYKAMEIVYTKTKS